ncbi:MAG: ImmA/IrrE family metallo-endopeptidase [bacterium]|jgi:Zn-dependent peptidase ImmA (M78 family)
MPFQLMKLADKENINIDYWDFAPPLEAVYWTLPDGKAFIGLSKELLSRPPHFRCVLAEELGHHFTTAGDKLPATFYHYSGRLEVNKAEYRAVRWAAEYLMPARELRKAIRKGLKAVWELAGYFNVTEHMVMFRLGLPDVDRMRI